ncbi:MAG TPA: CoA ester lyase [Rhizomicrobium sp.]|jgi:citrate lyase subunit beta/citryl-CoA lyase
MPFAIRPRRSVLYMPGSNPRAIEKARTLAADALILDLEDAVAPEAKDDARAQVCAAMEVGGFGKREVVIRINALGTRWGGADLGRAIAAKPDAILVPKVSSPSDLRPVQAALAATDVALWAMIETPRAILDIGAIAAAGGNLACFVMGTNDLIKELRGVHSRPRNNLAAALGLSVAAARAYGLAVIDGVFNDIADADGFRGSCAEGRAFGFDGKTLIHPSQIAVCNEIFAPSPQEVETARKVIEAFARPENAGKGAIALGGRMVERLHFDIARETIARTDAIAAMEIR